MTDGNGRVGRALTVLAVLLCLGPPAVVALIGVGASLTGAVSATVIVAGLVAVFHRGIPSLPVDHARRRPVMAALWVAILLAASWQTVRASVYANDVTQVAWSVVPGNPFRVEHCCFTAYAEAARLASEHKPVYDPEAYLPGGQRRRIGPLTVDPFHYPPPFLFLPSAVRLVAPDLFAARRVWFGLQALIWGATMLGVAWWVGGAAGRRVALLSAVVWATPQTFMALQTGNFQTTAIAVALTGGLLAASSRHWAGGGLLALAAAAKIFPVVLVLHAVAWLRRRTTLAMAVAGTVLVVASAAVYGVDTYVEFVRDELPRMLSGDAFPQTEHVGTAQANQSFYGLTTKLRVAGVTWLDRPTGRALARGYALLVVGVALLAGWRMRGDPVPLPAGERLATAMVFLAILNLAAAFSPFVGFAYGTYGTVWLATLLVASSRDRRQALAAAAGWTLVVVASMVIPSPRPAIRPDVATLVAALVGQMAGIALNSWVLWAWFARRRRVQSAQRR